MEEEFKQDGFAPGEVADYSDEVIDDGGLDCHSGGSSSDDEAEPTTAPRKKGARWRRPAEEKGKSPRDDDLGRTASTGVGGNESIDGETIVDDELGWTVSTEPGHSGDERCSLSSREVMHDSSRHA